MFIKSLIIIILVAYVFQKIVFFIFRGVFKNFVRQRSFGGQPYAQNSKKTSGGNIHIDSIPNEKSKKGDGFRGGEYVDYEEIK